MNSSGFPDVLCVGQAVLDCITRAPRQNPDRPASAVADSITLSIGGDAVNEALALTALGVSAAPVIAVGDDPAGRLITDELSEHGVSCDYVRTAKPPFRTPVANLTVLADGSRTSVSSPASAVSGFHPGELILPPVKLLSLASLFRAPHTDPDGVAALIRQAKEKGAIVCADTKLPTFWEPSSEELKKMLAGIDYIFPNEKEAAWYSKETDLEKMADFFLSLGIGRVVVKAGPDGCFGKGPEGFFHVPALPVRAIDTTGAGDHLVAGFIVALLGGASFRDCCAAGIRCASESITKTGGST